jgi:hypothetical protein
MLWDSPIATGIYLGGRAARLRYRKGGPNLSAGARRKSCTWQSASGFGMGARGDLLRKYSR